MSSYVILVDTVVILSLFKIAENYEGLREGIEGTDDKAGKRKKRLIKYADIERKKKLE